MRLGYPNFVECRVQLRLFFSTTVSVCTFSILLLVHCFQLMNACLCTWLFLVGQWRTQGQQRCGNQLPSVEGCTQSTIMLRIGDFAKLMEQQRNDLIPQQYGRRALCIVTI